MDMTKLEGKLPSGSLDFTVFEYILSLDDSDDNDSGQNLIFGFLGKAEETFDSIEESLLGQNEDRTEAPDSDDLDMRLERVTKAYEIVKNDYGDVKSPLREFYEELGDQKGN
ncbi:hypothetical protein CA14_006277 [Aspergillus flavus]|uniref:Uncharacterized protein n=1 Tax=Aspergillus flavus TaxID=5059 RepID=A0AB74BQY9_ASPFL|nr:hypothetical protein CA14_006277 [Aspergillus flavus]